MFIVNCIFKNIVCVTFVLCLIVFVVYGVIEVWLRLVGYSRLFLNYRYLGFVGWKDIMYFECFGMEECFIDFFVKYGYTWWFRRVMFVYNRDKIYIFVLVISNLYVYVLREICDSDNLVLTYVIFIVMCVVICGIVIKDCVV